MSLTEDTILQRVVVRRTAQKRAPITAHGSSGCYMDLKVDRAFVAKNTIDQTIIEKETGINTFKIYFANEEIYSKFPDKEIRIFRSEQKGTVVFLSQDQDQLSQIHLKPSRFKIFDNNNEQVTFDYIAEVASNFEALYHSFLRSLPIPLDKVDHN
jgi:hypothetical protein